MAPMTPLTMDALVGRRTLLGGAAAIGAAAAWGGGVAAELDAANAASLQGSLPSKVDVVVVGAGISGLVAARTLTKQGASVLVVEARDRVGGRIWNHHVKGGSVIEAGGAFVGPTQDHILGLAKELRVKTFKEYISGENVYISSTTGRTTFTGTIPPDPTILLDAAAALQQINSMAAEIPVDAPWTHPRAGEWDTMTLGEWLRGNTLNAPAIINLIANWTQPGFGADPDELSFFFTLWYIACSGNENNVGTFERNSDTVNGAQERRFVGGSQLVPIRMARQLGAQVALDAAVEKIQQRPDRRVVVTTTRGVVRAKRVIVAVPPPLALKIQWDPVLPLVRRQLLSHMPMGNLMKVDAVYKTPFWRKDGLSGYALNDAGPVRVTFDNSPPDAAVGVLLAFVGGATWRKYGTMPLARRRKAMLEGFAALFGPKALHPIEYTEQDWNKEPWTTGSPVAIMGPGTMTSFGHSIRTPFRGVHWAGTETSTYWTGYMDGAVRAGQRAAIEVLDALKVRS